MKIEGDSKLIAGAFIKARGEMNATVVKDAKGNFGKYVTLAAIVEATSATLAKNGLAVMQEVSTAEGGVTVETWLIHESGATMQFTPLTLPLTQRTPQAVGSAVTYARRYALGAICGLAPDDDDDAQAAEDATKPSRPAQQGRPQATQKAQGATTTPQRTVDASTGEIKGDDEGTPPHRRLWGQGASAFGADWNMARAWLIRNWTEKVVKSNVRESATDLNDDEKDMLADYIKANIRALQASWKAHKAVLIQSTSDKKQPAFAA
jgi:hypothetical protein